VSHWCDLSRCDRPCPQSDSGDTQYPRVWESGRFGDRGLGGVVCFRYKSLTMSEYTILLKPVYSLTVPTPEEVSLPDGWNLSWHQAETFRALNDPNLDVVFNTAMTGDGKSLAAYLQAMTGRAYTIAMYPTNELARDQEHQVQEYKKLFNPKYDPQIYRLNGATLADFVETNQLPSRYY
jgi:CRISPR-associated endonuclease/helicase Cas3